MKKIVVIIALALFLKPIFPVIEYAIDYDYITKVLCENKSKPAMHCNGKCHLMKQLAKEAENNKPVTPNKKPCIQETEIFFGMHIPAFEFPKRYGAALPQINTYYVNLYNYAVLDYAFRPPAV
jgi:hypothetical protein